MTNPDISMAQLADLFDSVQAGMSSIEKMQREWALLTATGTAARGLVTVSINAEGTVIETRFAGEIDELSYSEIADAVTEAAQAAMTEMRQKTAALMAPVQEPDARIGSLSELAPGAPDIVGLVPAAPQVSIAAPGSPERLSGEAEVMEFTGTENIDRDPQPSKVTEKRW
ncbi:YbaB/EbfC family nucleoid-associated protein [Nocardia sp. NPDC019395]|uniref:YbaB/EbfC family nucleoid-associated protein n=1 Tax=Nocardia sp. NPDC019395 TaxID=3154686 RepID=UPI0033D71B8C